MGSILKATRRRLSSDAKWRVAAAAMGIGLLMCGALVVTVRSHYTSVQAKARAHQDHEKTLAAEQAVSAFWKEREAMSEFLAFPDAEIAAEVRAKGVVFREALRAIDINSSADVTRLERARTGNETLMILFEDQKSLSGRAEIERGALRLHNAELAVLAPIAQLRAENHRDSEQAEAIEASALRAAYRTGIVSSLLGLAAICWFAIFAVRLVGRNNNQTVELQVADAADKAKDDLISTVSHELRTPLTSIHGFVELLLDPAGDPLTEQQRGFLATVLRGSRRLERLVDDLLLTAQLSTGLLDIRRTTTDLAKLVRESVADAQAEAGRRELQLSLNVTPHTITVDADVVRLAQALDNVISNAIKFTPEGGRVDVTLAHDAGRATLTVADTGMGMTPVEIGRLFERFFRTDSAQTKQIQGTGLGLPIVRAIIDAHDGTITVTSEPNVGTSFEISLPLVRLPERRLATAGVQEHVAA